MESQPGRAEQAYPRDEAPFARAKMYIYQRRDAVRCIASQVLTLAYSETVYNISVTKRNLKVDSHRDQPHTTLELKTGSGSLAKTED
mgnify:CR=1 FL=1